MDELARLLSKGAGTLTPAEMIMLQTRLRMIEAQLAQRKTQSASATDASITLSDVTTNDASASKHGWFPKLPSPSGKYLMDDPTWGTPGSAPFAAPTIALGSAAAAGAATTTLRSDATIAAFDTTPPANQAFGDAAATGAAAYAARRDHKHGMPAAPDTNPNLYITTADYNLGAGSGIYFAGEYEIGSGFVTDLASTAIMEIG